jgi:nitroreductase
MTDPRFIPYRPPRIPTDVALERAVEFYRTLDERRSVRMFSGALVPRALIEECVRAAGTAPSGAHKQPWTYVAVSDATTKSLMRAAAEKVEHENYEWRMPPEWKEDLAPLGTDFVKEHLTTAPWVIVVFQQDYALTPDGKIRKHYYVTQSVGISVGMFVAACTVAGLATLIHTPSPMSFLSRILGRPRNEKAFAVIPVGYPAPDCRVPDLRRKELAEFLLVDPAPVAGTPSENEPLTSDAPGLFEGEF